jgi:hypothetical protein
MGGNIRGQVTPTWSKVKQGWFPREVAARHLGRKVRRLG